MITVPTKDVGEVRDCFTEPHYIELLEERNIDYIKKEFGIDGR